MKKFAVFLSETGYYCYRYCESTEDLAGTIFASIIREDQFPVVLDGKGGYFSFSPSDPGFRKVIESDLDEPLTLEQMYFKNSPHFKLGWISPEGDTYACNYTSHEKCALKLAQHFFPNARFPERALDRAGWIKVIDSWDGTERQHGQYVFSLTGRITSKQADTLYDLKLYYNEEVQRLIRDSENTW